MNEPIRRLSVVTLLLFLTLMVAASWVQFAKAGELGEDPRNVRTLYRQFGSFRGPIIVDGQSIVSSVPVDDPFNYQRIYADGPLYAPVTGYYSIGPGRSGLEATENALLDGSADALFWTRLGELFAGQEQEGASVELTLDADVQRAAYDALAGKSGAVVALDPRTGAILAMVSTPTYDPAALAVHSSSEANRLYEALLADQTDPLFNRAIGGDTYAPGSTFKLVVAAAALESGYTPETLIYAPQELTLPGTTATISNYGGSRCGPTDNITLAEALRVSCNTAFADLAMRLGWGVIERTAAKFGWGEQLEIPLDVTPSRLPDNPNEPQVAQSGIGQFDVRATPLQMAMVAAAIANDGVLMKPYLVSTVRDPDLRVIEHTSPEELSSALSRDAAGALNAMMQGVVANGTGSNAQISGVSVAGKTGTAETGTDAAPHTWFVAFAPADDPVVAVAVLVENGGDLGSEATGGKVAAPIAKAVIQAAIASAAGGS
ncbi:penicillin-binding protein 2 [Demequina sp. TTPB684]|uniref:peptidoglycan D,D-transpeptidase FtsI family protein n=1 Tax=unclassified Demequina TaxID=2620311 RepID=UPI001CF2B26A|nr:MULTISPECIES: penicillin-binding transpeptidase domain-containing protein [unclassified Demequina]MCB2411313.1 penicillin-binding protein 2 [Demequina sp. TTPB684]UPU87913.1 penicillin-binding transpeptidase domain-containing protein [Demequina sp. TMPB413]